METINTRIRKIREECAGKNKDFAQIMGEKRNTVNNWVREGYSVGLSVILKIAEKFENVDLNWLLTGSGSMLKNISENSENLLKQSEKEDRNNSIDKIINQKLEELIMEHLDKMVDTVMKRMNQQIDLQNKHMREVLKIQSDDNAQNFKVLVDAIKEIVKEEDIEKFERKIIPLKAKIGG